MKNNKLQKERNKATSHLLRYVEKEKWAELKSDYFIEMWDAVADELNTNGDAIIHCLMDGGQFQNATIFLLENLFTIHWEGEPMSLLEEYIKQRAWRETPHARQYLRAFSKSFVGLYEVVDSKKGEYIIVRELAHENTKKIYDKSASEKISKWSWIAARVITLNQRKMFTGSGLALSSEDINSIFEEVDLTRAQIFEEIKKENKKTSSLKMTKEELDELADNEAASQIQDIIFKVWATKAYLSLNQGAPIMLNKDDELYKQVDVSFSTNPKDRKIIIALLNDADFLDNVEKNKKWAWVGCHKDKIPELGTTLLGEFTLASKCIKLSVNSDKRAQKGQEYLKELLKDLIGAPLSTEKSMQDLLSENKSSENQPSQNLLEDNEEATAIISKIHEEHYRKILDDKIPALDNKTPRQCAQEKNMKPKLIQWLKGLENSTSKATPQMQEYDFKWMWKELSLKYPHTK